MAEEVKNYITPGGSGACTTSSHTCGRWSGRSSWTTIAWAAGNGDRSENGDYIYGKRKLREIDRRIRYLSKRLDRADVVDNAGKTHERVYFGATVTVSDETGEERKVTIVGVDELDPTRGRVSWLSPLARALLNASVGDMVTLARRGDPKASRWSRSATRSCDSYGRTLRKSGRRFKKTRSNEFLKTGALMVS